MVQHSVPLAVLLEDMLAKLAVSDLLSAPAAGWQGLTVGCCAQGCPV